jgi:peroxiredoxin
MKKIPGIILAIMFLTSITILTGCSGDNSQNSQIYITAPDFKLQNLDGQTISLSSFRGKAVFINFWATTCPPCVKEMPYLQELYTDWSARNDVVILSIDMGESEGTILNFMQSHNLTLPVLLDSQLKVAEKYRIQYTPTSILVGKDGQVKYRVIGAFKDKAAIVKAVEGYLTK